MTTPQKRHIESLFAQPAVPLRHIKASLQEQFPENNTTWKDLNNMRYKHNKAALAGLTPTQALIKVFDNERIKYAVRFDDLDPLRPTALLWTYPWNEQIWKQFWWVLQLDNTYKTNRFKMALFQACIVTNLGTTITVAYGLVDNERQEGFDWLISSLDEVRNRCEIPKPTVVITDDEKALRNALEATWPSATLQLCIFHVGKNVIANIKRKFRKSLQAANDEADAEAVDEGGWLYERDDAGGPIPTQFEAPDDHGDDALADLEAEAKTGNDTQFLGEVPITVEVSMAGVYLLWKHMLYAPTEEHLEAAWAKMQEIFSPQQSLLTYFRLQHLPSQTQWAHCYIARNANFGQRTTSPTESAHKALKVELVNGNSTLLQLHEAIQRLMQAKKQAFDHETDGNRIRIPVRFNGKAWLTGGDCLGRLSYKALTLLEKQYRKALPHIPTPSQPVKPELLPRCTKQWSTQFGLPCAHQIIQLLAPPLEPLTKDLCHRFWWLARDLTVENHYFLIKDPKKVTALKGRPLNQGGPFTSTGEAPTRSQQPRAARGGHRMTSSVRRDPSN